MPIDQEITHKCLNLLDELLQADPIALANLIKHHTPCNQQLANHPTVQVRGYGHNHPAVGLLGILNGLCGTYPDEPNKGFGPITAQIDSNGKITAFRLTRPIQLPDPFTKSIDEEFNR